MLNINGSYGEGGGQIVRTALALSTLTGIPFSITNIRKARPQPGLKAQHLHCIKALEQLCNARAENAFLGSTKLTFYPGKIQSKTISIDIGTAGSISLLLQSILLPSMFAPGKVRLRIKGGTAGKWAMPFEYFMHVLVPTISLYAEIEPKLIRRGYYPKGNGFVDIKIIPFYSISEFDSFEQFLKHMQQNAPKINLTEQGKLIAIRGISHASSDLQKNNVAERQAKSAKQTLASLDCPIKIDVEYSNTLSTGSGITLWAIFEHNDKNYFLGSDALGERSKRAEIVGKEAAEKLLFEINSKACADQHLADNLVPFLIFGGSVKTSVITEHCRTNVWVCNQFIPNALKIEEKNKTITFIKTHK